MKKQEQPNHTDRGHAEFSPSSLKYVAACAAYHGKDGTSAAAEKGTRIHEALEVWDPSALHNEEELEIYEQIVEMEKQFMSNFPPIEEEMNEIQVDIQLKGTSTWGTCDRFLILKGRKRAIMADYKTGISIIDPPENNWQAKAYTIGAFQKYPEIEKIVFAFYVPMHDATLEHTFNREDLPDMVEELSAIITAGEKIRPKWQEGTPEIEECNPTQYCRFCRYEDSCPALGGLVISVAKKLDSTLPDIDPSDLTDPARASEVFNIAKIVENWSGAMKKVILDRMKAGEEVAGLKLRSMGRTRKCAENNLLVQIAEEFGVSQDEIIREISIPLGKLSKLVGDSSSKEDRKINSQKFLDACEDAGIVTTSAERFSIATQ